MALVCVGSLPATAGLAHSGQGIEIKALARGDAMLTITHRFQANGWVADQTLGLVHPERSVVVEAAFRVGQRGWRRAELLDKEAAQVRYEALVNGADNGKGRAAPTMLIAWQDSVSVSLGGIASGEAVSVRLRYFVTGTLEDGRWKLGYPERRDRLSAKDVSGNRVLLEPETDRCGPRPSGYVLSWPRDPAGGHILIGGRALTVDVGHAGHATHIQFNAGSVLRRHPRGMRVSIVVDVSRSAIAGFDGHRPLISDIIKEHPSASFQVVAFARHARRLWPGFVDPSEATRRLARAAFPRRANGSSLEAALELVGLDLQRASKPGRVFVLTDGEMRQDFAHGAVRRGLARAGEGLDAVHVIVSAPRRSTWRVHHGDHPLRPLLKARGGLLVESPPRLDAANRLALADATAFPRQLRQVRWNLVGSDGAVMAKGIDGELWADHGVSGRWLMTPRRAHALVVTGTVWGRRRSTTIPTRPARRTGALLAIAQRGRLTKEVQSLVTRGTRAVGPHLSALSTHGSGPASLRRSRGGVGGGMGFSGRSCCGVGGMRMTRRPRVHSAAIGPGEFVAAVVSARALKDCGIEAGASAELMVETTGDEIVDLGLAPKRWTSTQRQCAETIAWDVELPAGMGTATRTRHRTQVVVR